MAIVRQVPCPGCGNWMDRGIARCQECGEILPPVTRKQLAHAQEVADGSLTALREEQQRKAEALTVSDEQLEAWYRQQLAAAEARVARLGEALEQNHARLKGADDPNWARWYEQVARYEYAESTLALLRERRHVLCCPNCGIEGVTGLGLMAETEEQVSEAYEALSLRGLLADEGATAWSRYCLFCSKPQLEQAAQRMMRAHEAPIPEVGGYSGKPMRPAASRRRAGGELGGKAVSTLRRGAK